MKLLKEMILFKERLFELSRNGELTEDDCTRINNELDEIIKGFDQLPPSEENELIILELMICKIEIELSLTYLTKLKYTGAS